MIVTVLAGCVVPIRAQQQTPNQSAGTVTVSAQAMEQLQQHLAALEAEVAELKAQMKETRSASSPGPASGASAELAHDTTDGAVEGAVLSSSGQASQGSALLSADDRSILNYLKGTTIDVSLDAYYAYNFNNPVGG